MPLLMPTQGVTPADDRATEVQWTKYRIDDIWKRSAHTLSGYNLPTHYSEPYNQRQCACLAADAVGLHKTHAQGCGIGDAVCTSGQCQPQYSMAVLLRTARTLRPRATWAFRRAARRVRRLRALALRLETTCQIEVGTLRPGTKAGSRSLT